MDPVTWGEFKKAVEQREVSDNDLIMFSLSVGVADGNIVDTRPDHSWVSGERVTVTRIVVL